MKEFTSPRFRSLGSPILVRTNQVVPSFSLGDFTLEKNLPVFSTDDFIDMALAKKVLCVWEIMRSLMLRKNNSWTSTRTTLVAGLNTLLRFPREGIVDNGITRECLRFAAEVQPTTFP